MCVCQIYITSEFAIDEWPNSVIHQICHLQVELGLRTSVGN